MSCKKLKKLLMIMAVLCGFNAQHSLASGYYPDAWIYVYNFSSHTLILRGSEFVDANITGGGILPPAINASTPSITTLHLSMGGNDSQFTLTGFPNGSGLRGTMSMSAAWTVQPPGMGSPTSVAGYPGGQTYPTILFQLMAYQSMNVTRTTDCSMYGQNQPNQPAWPAWQDGLAPILGGNGSICMSKDLINGNGVTGDFVFVVAIPADTTTLRPNPTIP
ncbi:MAG: hypothetical protein Q7V63_03520 [Gammaproteobacteria bacterium]|nr:hypothetical protein [Gammaproteobacteria bacterium]